MSKLSKIKQLKKDLNVPREKIGGYFVNCEYGLERIDEEIYSKVKAIVSKWKPIKKVDEMNGKIDSQVPLIMSCNCTKSQVSVFRFFDIGYDKATHKIVKRDDNSEGLSKVIPSALALYRALCLFKCHVLSEGPRGYKFIWSINLEHKATGEVLGLGEWKGAFDIFSKDIGNQEFFNDVLELLNLLISDECPHPYDGCVAGSVA